MVSAGYAVLPIFEFDKNNFKIVSVQTGTPR